MNQNNNRKRSVMIALLLTLLGLVAFTGCKITAEDAAGNKVIIES